MPACACTGSLEGGYLALGIPHETLIHIARVNVSSRDRAGRVDAEDAGSLTRARACTRNVERGYLARGGPHKAVARPVHIDVVSRDSPRRVDAERESPLMKALACAPSFEDRDLFFLRSLAYWRNYIKNPESPKISVITSPLRSTRRSEELRKLVINSPSKLGDLDTVLECFECGKARWGKGFRVVTSKLTR
jgi:hypothetical protein